MSGIVRGDSLRDFAKPIIQQARWPGIQRRHGPHDAGAALRDHKLRRADNKERRRNHRQGQSAQNIGMLGHAYLVEFRLKMRARRTRGPTFIRA